MLENEDSVVTSLNELRKLKHERISRQSQSRVAVGAGRAAALAVDPASDQMTPPPASVSALGQVGGGFQSVPGPANAGFGTGFVVSAPTYAASAPPIIQTKTSMKAAVVVAIVLVGAGGVGYMKLQSEMQAQLAAKDAAIRTAEDARNQSVETAAKAEVQARNNLRQCEDKLKAALAMVPAAPAVTAPSAPVVEKKPEPRVSARASRRAARASRRSAAQGESAGSKSADVPTIAKKKRLDNDPLSGLGKP
jgi:hypothetical protein